MYQRLLKQTLDTQIPFRASFKYTRLMKELAHDTENKLIWVKRGRVISDSTE